MENIDELKEALEFNNLEVLKRILNSNNINSSFIDEDGDTLFLYGLSLSNDEVCDYLENLGANIYAINSLGETIFHSLVFYGEVNRLKKYLEKYPNLINIQDNEGVTPLYLALSLKKFEIFNTFLDFDADINIADKEGGTPTHFCCIYGYEDCLKRLIDKGAEVNIKTNDGNLPIAYAINNGHINIFRYLYKKYYD